MEKLRTGNWRNVSMKQKIPSLIHSAGIMIIQRFTKLKCPRLLTMVGA